jgi:hypothetical protein
MKRYKLISCSVFKNFVENFISENMLPVDAMFIPMGMHLNPEKLNKELQDEIDKAGKGYQAILLLYGLCGNSVLGLTAREIPIIIPRAHDCCTLFLESRKKFLENFEGKQSSEWYSADYLEEFEKQKDSENFKKEHWYFGLEYEKLVEEYGEDNAKYIYETIHGQSEKSEIFFIKTGHEKDDYNLIKVEKEAAEKGVEVVELDGGYNMLKNLLRGQFSEEDYLVVPPGHSVAGIYDNEKIICAVERKT